MSKLLTNDQIESIKQEMYDCYCDLELVIYMFKMYYLEKSSGNNDYRSITFYQGILDYLTYPQKGI